MSCVVGIVENGIVYIGADSANLHQDTGEMRLRKDTAVFRRKDILLGYIGPFRHGHILKCEMDLPEPRKGQDPLDYIASDFMPAGWHRLTRGLYMSDETGLGQVLLGYHGRLFVAGSDLQISESLEAYEAIGSGADLALGALFATHGKDPEERIITALEAAANFNAYVRPPYHIEKV